MPDDRLWAVVEWTEEEILGVHLATTEPIAHTVAVDLAEENGLDPTECRKTLEQHGVIQDGAYIISVALVNTFRHTPGEG